MIDTETTARNCTGLSGSIGVKKVAQPGEFTPHISAIGWKNAYGSIEFKCAGALISPSFILTAARCGADKLVTMCLLSCFLNIEYSNNIF